MVAKKIRLLLALCFGINIVLPQALTGAVGLPERLPDNMPKRSVAHYQDDKEFADKVRKYVEHVCSKQQAEAQKILNAIGIVHKHIEYDELKQILEDVAQVHTHLQADAQDTAAHEELRCALLLKIAVPLSEFVRKAILHTLNDLDKQIKYWEYQQSHPISYFFHKSPSKWFAHKKQSQEIFGSLRQLRYVQTEHFKLLGFLKIHLNSFDNKAIVSDQYEWIGELLFIVNQLCTGKDLKVQEIASYNKLLPLMQNLLDKVEGHQDKIIDNVVADAQKPNHFVRNWWKYSAGASSALAAWYCGYYNQKNREKIIDLATDFGKGFWKEVVSSPVQGIRNLFMENTENPEEKESIFESLDKGLDTLDDKIGEFKSHFKQRQTNTDDEEVVSESKKEEQEVDGEVDPTLWDNLKSVQNSVKSIHSEIKRTKEKDDGWLAKYLKGKAKESLISPEQEAVFNREIDNITSDIEKIFSKLEGHSANASFSIHNVLDGVQSVIQQLKVGLCDMRDKADGMQGMIKQHRVTIALLRLIPLGVIGFGAGAALYKTYKTLRGKPNYEPIRTALIDIAHLLNQYEDAQPDEMRPEDYGKLLYLGYRLKKERRLVPDEKRNLFVADIYKLSSAWLTADKKMRVVDLMYKTYDFLTPTYVG